MNTLSFTGEMARLQQAITETQDIVVRRGTVLEALSLRSGERVLELGCGGGHLSREAAQFVGAAGQVCAVDISPDQIVAAQARCADLGWVDCRIADIAALPYGDGTFDAVIAATRLSIYPISTPVCARSIACCDPVGGRSSWRQIGVGNLAFGKRSAQAAGADSMGAAYTLSRSAVDTGGTATLGWDAAVAARGDPDPQHFL
jgi:SAM-dependent methyltransferase